MIESRPQKPDDRIRTDSIEEDSVDILDFARTLWRGKAIIVLFTLAAVAIGATYAMYLVTPRYAATADLVIEPQQDNVVDLERVVSGVSSDSESMNTELLVLMSRGLVTKLVEDLDLHRDPEFNGSLRPEPAFSVRKGIDQVRTWAGFPPEERAPETEDQQFNSSVNAVMSAVGATINRGTYVIRIRAETESRQKSVQIANTLADIYIQDQVDIKFQKTEQAAAWLSERVVQLQSEIEEKEDLIAELQASSDFATPARLSAINVQLSESRQRADRQQNEVDRLQTALDGMRDARASQSLDEMVAAASSYSRFDRSDLPIPQDGTVNDAFLAQYDRIAANLQSDLDRSREQLEILNRSVDTFRRQMEEQSDKVSDVQQVQRDLEATTVLYENFLTRLKETTVQQGIQSADARVLSQAVSARQTEPQTTRLIAISGLLGMIAGAALVLLYEMTRRAYRTSTELERATGYPVIGQIPKMPIRARENLVRYLRDKPTSAAVEAVRNMRTSILLSNVDNPPKVIMSTSSIPGEGKTTQAVCLANNLSGLGKRVLLLEGDVRRRTLHSYFPKVTGPGFVSVLNGDAELSEAINRSDDLGADILLGQKSNVNAADLFASNRFQELLTYLRKRYDYIVIDTPPVLVVPDARVIGQHVDAIIYSVGWDRTSKAQVNEGLAQLRSVNLNVTGTVLAQIDPKGMKRYGYGGRYGAYSTYGRRYYDN